MPAVNCIYFLFSVCKFLTGLLLRGFSGARAEYFKILPMLCVNESNEFEPHLAQDCTVALACLATCILPLQIIPTALEDVASVAKSSSWKAKAAVLELLEVIRTLNGRDSNYLPLGSLWLPVGLKL